MVGFWRYRFGDKCVGLGRVWEHDIYEAPFVPNAATHVNEVEGPREQSAPSTE